MHAFSYYIAARAVWYNLDNKIINIIMIKITIWLSWYTTLNTEVVQAHSQKCLLGGSFGQNVDLFGKIVDLFYKTVDLLNKIEDIFSKIMAF